MLNKNQIIQCIFIILLLWGSSSCDRNKFETAHPDLKKIIHLDPRLSTGQTPADILAEKKEVVLRQKFGKQEDDVVRWKIKNADCMTPKDGIGIQIGVKDQSHVTREDMRPTDHERLLYYDAPLNVKDVNLIEMDVRMVVSQHMLLSWRVADDPIFAKHEIRVSVSGSPKKKHTLFLGFGNQLERGDRKPVHHPRSAQTRFLPALGNTNDFSRLYAGRFFTKKR